MDIVSIVSLASLGVFALFALMGFVRGMFKGAFRSIADTVFVLLNAVASALISKGIVKLISKPKTVLGLLEKANGFLKNESLTEIIDKVQPYLEDGEFLAEAELGFVMALPAVILTPILFMIVFLLMGGIFKIIKAIVQKLFIPKTKNIGLRLIGGLFGAARAVLALAIFLVPIIGFATYGVNTIDLINQTSGDGKEVIENPVEEYEEIVTKGTLKVVSTCGGKWFFETLATTQVDNVKISLVDETENGVNIYSSVKPLLEIDSTNFTSKDTTQIDSVISQVENSEYLTVLLASILSQVSGEVYENGEIIGFKVPNFGKTFDPVVKTLLQVLSKTTRADVIGDLRTYSNTFKHTVNFGLFKELNEDGGDIFTVLENGKFYSSILTELYINERTRPTVPSVANAIQSYLHEVYENVNGKPYDEEVAKVDENKINEQELVKEGNRIALAITEIRVFSKTVENIEYVDDIVKRGDFAALGRGLNQIRDSVYFGDSYKFLLDTLLHSESCANLGIFDTHFIENATKPNADMEALLLSRQHLAILTMAMWDNDEEKQKDALIMLLEHASEEDSEALKELAALENLEKYGVKGEKGETVSSIAVSLADTIHNHEYIDENGDGSVEDEKHEEAEKTAEILTVLNGVHNNESESPNVFDDGSEQSKTGETAEGIVDKIVDSDIAKEMIQSAVTSATQDGENLETDPYQIQSSLTDADKANMKSALINKYATAETEGDKQAVENIAYIFGIDLTALN